MKMKLGQGMKKHAKRMSGGGSCRITSRSAGLTGIQGGSHAVTKGWQRMHQRGLPGPSPAADALRRALADHAGAATKPGATQALALMGIAGGSGAPRHDGRVGLLMHQMAAGGRQHAHQPGLLGPSLAAAAPWWALAGYAGAATRPAPAQAPTLMDVAGGSGALRHHAHQRGPLGPRLAAYAPWRALAGVLPARSRSRSSWNDCLEHWERPASGSEEDRIQRSATMVQDALGRNDWLAREGVQVRPQGSYHNNTNVRQDSDMDLCVWHPGIQLEVEDGLSVADVHRRFGYSYTGRMVHEIAAELRRQVGHALRAMFGGANVEAGNKAFRVPAVPGSRVNADVVPAMRLDYVFKRNTALLAPLDPIEGVVIHAADGTRILNFPERHHENGKAKRERTGRRFKKVVRCAKRLRDELVTMGRLRPGGVPSFLIECLVYGVEDEVFLFEGDRYDRMCWVLDRIREQVSDPCWSVAAHEINGVNMLFHPSQPWSVAGVQTFVAAALRRLGA